MADVLRYLSAELDSGVPTSAGYGERETASARRDTADSCCGWAKKMKVIVNRQALAKALALTCSVVPTRTPKPVLACVRLSAAAAQPRSAGTLQCVSTDLEMTLETSLAQVDVQREGVALLPANKIAEIVNASPDETLTIDVHGDKATIKGSDSTSTLLGFAVEEFPPINGFDGAADLTMPAALLKVMLDRTRFAAAKEMTRYAMNGVLFERKGKKLSLVATDGHRLALARDEVETGESKDISAIVPIKAIGMLERLLEDPEQTIKLQFRENKLYVQVLTGGEKTNSERAPGVPGQGGTSKNEGFVAALLSTALVEGSFPPYQDVIPKDCDHKVSVNRTRFQSAVSRAAVLTSEESKAVCLGFAPKLLTVIGRAPEMGETKVEIPIDYGYEPLEIGFNSQYLLDALKAAPMEDVVFELRSPTKPGIIRSGNNFLYVVMPVNLGSGGAAV